MSRKRLGARAEARCRAPHQGDRRQQSTEMRQRVLLVAAELDLRARFARELQSSGYAVELASDVKRALRLAAKHHVRIAVVVPGPSLAGWAICYATPCRK